MDGNTGIEHTAPGIADRAGDGAANTIGRVVPSPVQVAAAWDN